MYCWIVKITDPMTTYTYNLSLDDREVIALKHALKCYMSSEVQELIAKNPTIGAWGNTEIIRDIVERRLNANVELRSKNNFFERNMK
jgi:hypothetical protein